MTDLDPRTKRTLNQKSGGKVVLYGFTNSNFESIIFLFFQDFENQFFFLKKKRFLFNRLIVHLQIFVYNYSFHFPFKLSNKSQI